jgi:tRNA pseudouridine55 synthase
MSSSQAVGNVKKLLHPTKIGHAGTLDPLATGVLPLALGEATKTSNYAMNNTKIYHFTLRFGEQTSTDDAEGEVIATSTNFPDETSIKVIISTFIGTIAQTPPAFSAIKIDGKRAYALARAGEEVEMKSRDIHIENLTLLRMDDERHATFEVVCGKGTYIRSLARDLALALGSVGHVSMLRRVAVGKFDEKNIISLEKLAEIVHNRDSSEEAASYLLKNKVIFSPDAVLDDIPAVRINEEQGARLRNGQALLALEVGETTIALDSLRLIQPRDIGEGRTVKLVKALYHEQLIALLELKGRRLLTVRMFCY